METIAESLTREGREAGIVLGMAKGTKQGMLAVAKNMLADQFDITVTTKMTGLPIEQIRALQPVYA